MPEARAAAGRFFGAGAKAIVIKAQVLVGGRGKAGGVKLASTPDEGEQVARAILGMDIKGIPVRKVLVAPAADIVREYYMAAVLDRAARRILLMGSAEGGVEIEQVAADTPEAIVRHHADPMLGLLDYQAREFAFAMGLAKHLKTAVAIAEGLVRTMVAYDADLVEINPLAIVRETDAAGATAERLVCLDAKVTLDDSALPRHPELEALRDPDEEDPADREAREAGLTFIKLDGTIGCMVNGAGLAMTTMDLVKRAGGEPANFLDIGGGARADRVAAAMRIILGDPKVERHPRQHLRRDHARRRGRPRADRGAGPAGPRRADGRPDRRDQRDRGCGPPRGRPGSARRRRSTRPRRRPWRHPGERPREHPDRPRHPAGRPGHHRARG